MILILDKPNMYIYNLTTNILEQSEEKWLTWMRQTHIPEMLATGKFTKASLIKVMVQEEMGGVTYTAQYTCTSADKLKSFYREDAPRLSGKVMWQFPNQVVVFGTELKVIFEKIVV